MIIIPDVHGRKFWHEAVKGRETEQIIFLGDYLDPYEAEGIWGEAAIVEFDEIIKFKKAHMNNVTLLLGNHDFMYIAKNMGFCRTDFENYDFIHNMLENNRGLFEVAKYEAIDGHFVTFSHSWFMKSWATNKNVASLLDCDTESVSMIIDRLNEMWASNDTNLYKVLNVISRSRGGYGNTGSPVWADIHDFEFSRYVDIVQVFGHSQQLKHPYIVNELDTDDNTMLACLDCRRAFELNEGFVFKPITQEDNLYDRYINY